MTSLSALARLGLLAVVAGAVVAMLGRHDGAAARAESGAEPPLLGAVPAVPVAPVAPALPVLPVPPPDCLPTDPPPPVLKIKVRVPACQMPGRPIEYRLCVENCSTAEAHHVLLKNPLPANAAFVRADPAPAVLAPELQWPLGTIGGGACREVVLVLQPTNSEEVKNCARVQFEHGVCVTTRQAGYPPVVPLPPGTAPPVVPMPPAAELPATPEPPTAPAPLPKITTEEAPALTLTIEGHQRQYVNLASHYFLTVTNTGKTRATNLLVSCALPEQTKFERGSAGAKVVAGQVAWVLGDLEPGGRRTVELVLKAQAEGQYCVRATARADRGATAQAEACTQFIGVSALHVELTDRNDPLVVGGRTSYLIVVRSQGSAPVTSLKVKVLVPAALQLVDVKGPTKYELGAKTEQGQWVELAPLARLEPATSQTYEVFVEARQAAESRLKVEVSADQLERGPVIDEESTTLFKEEG